MARNALSGSDNAPSLLASFEEVPMPDWMSPQPDARRRRAAGRWHGARAVTSAALVASLAACSNPTPPAVLAAAPIALATGPSAPAQTKVAVAPVSPVAGRGVWRDEKPEALEPNARDRKLVTTLAWGNGPRALGKHEGSEQNPTAPMAIAAGATGLWILDQVNGRVVRLQGVGEAATLVDDTPVALADPYDLALDDLDAVAPTLLVLDRQVDGVVVALTPGRSGERWRMDIRGDGGAVFDPEAAPGPSGLAFGGGITGLFVHDGGVWVEWAHERCHRLGGLDGGRVGIGLRMPGRPDQQGRFGLSAERLGDHVFVSGRSLAASAAETMEPTFRVGARFAHPVFALRAVEDNGHGEVWVAANTLRERDGGQIVAEGLDVVLLGRNGGVDHRGSATLEQGPHEQARTFSAGADGGLWHLARRHDGIVVERWQR